MRVAEAVFALGCGSAGKVFCNEELAMMTIEDLHTQRTRMPQIYHPDKMPPQRNGQAYTMTASREDDELEAGHWYSPEAARDMLAAERELCAQLCHDSDDCEEAARRIRAGQTEAPQPRDASPQTAQP